MKSIWSMLESKKRGTLVRDEKLNPTERTSFCKDVIASIFTRCTLFMQEETRHAVSWEPKEMANQSLVVG